MSAPNASNGPISAATQPRNPISRARLEVIAGRTVAAFGLVFGIQTLPGALAQLPAFKEPIGIIVEIAIFGGLVVVLICAIVQRWVRQAMGTVAIVYLIVLITWPLTALDPSVQAQKPWAWFLCSVATAYAAIAFPVPWATAYTILTPLVYGVVRTLPSGGGQSAEIGTLDAAYAVILGGVILVIIAMLRQAASAVDTAQTTALERYANAVRQHATEVERVQVDAIVHDSVLTTLLSAASARTPEAKALAARMASDAIGHLHAAEAVDPEDNSLVGLDRLRDRLRAAAAAFSAPFEIAVRGVSSQLMPVQVAEAVYSATVQAMVNSMQHAGGPDVTRSLSIVGGGPTDTVIIRIDDTGVGFNDQEVPAERLGLRVSIRERLEKVGGEAHVRSSPGEGTTVIVRWPSAQSASLLREEQEQTLA
jgi:signal transduction histidine kinase